ncbi:ribosomal-processing cysteine protease Prp [Bacillus pinisoli]|uniref:ribosomal-processing cysteine protease Prp n=1 Tax=Bacillus pinisoli TaxID=2901866 RepID=UPI001FF6E287|nr:ribosomal-processing cysteine protease Prp [Bacillus pinisoli]
MIKVTINRASTQQLKSVTISGHAEYDEPGKDIVCAGVSAVTFGAANAVEILCGIALHVEQGKSGFLHFVIPSITDGDKLEKVLFLMEGMLVSLRTIERSYTDFINITEEVR